MRLNPKTSKPVDYAMNIILISKALLTRLINNAVSLNQDSFVRVSFSTISSA